MFGKQFHYCAVCGKLLYDDRLSNSRPSLCNTKRCREQFIMRYTRSVLGKNALEIDLVSEVGAERSGAD